MALLQLVKNACLRRYKLVLFVYGFVVFVIALYIIHLLVSEDSNLIDPPDTFDYPDVASNKDPKPNLAFYLSFKDLQKVPSSWTNVGTCPACFGTNLCTAIESGDVMIEIPEEPSEMSQKGIFAGRWNHLPIVLQTMSTDDPRSIRFDSFICQNVTGKYTCDVSQAISKGNSYAMQNRAFLPEALQSMWRIARRKESKLVQSFAVCASKELVLEFSKDFDKDKDHLLTVQETAMLFTSLALNPKPLVLQLLQREMRPSLVVPSYHGACGRVVVLQHGGQPLADFLDAPWAKRADLALQVLSFVDTLWRGSTKWFFWFGDFHFDNFAVSEFGELSMVDPEELAIILKPIHSAVTDDLEGRPGTTICNAECFHNVAQAVREGLPGAGQQQKACASLPPKAGPFMFALACQHMLSDLSKHRKTSLNPGRRGLLHSPPASEATSINELLEECVQETAPRGRMAAIDSLVSLLTPFTMEVDY